jgi:hypothetical protein
MKSEDYLKMVDEGYQGSIDEGAKAAALSLGNKDKWKVINDRKRVFVPYSEAKIDMTGKPI